MTPMQMHRHSVTVKSEGKHSVPNVHLYVLCLIDRTSWVLDECGTVIYHFLDGRREEFFSEISLYDLLFSENLFKQYIRQLKQIAVDLLAKLKTKIAELDHWTDKQETKTAVDNLVRDILWVELPECYAEISISGYR